MTDEELIQEREDLLELANTGKDETWRIANRQLRLVTAEMLRRGL
jgi:hypothetical protein